MMGTAARKLVTLPKRIAEFIEPMDCAAVSKLPDGWQWIYELKLDGYRAIGVKSDRGMNLYSRRGKSFNHQYPHIVEALGELPEGTVVDGEIVALDKSGRPNFNLLQNWMRDASLRKLYFVFDLLVCEDRDCTKLPLHERRELMKSVLKLRSGPHPHLRAIQNFSRQHYCGRAAATS
jgi:bifunctional non-homologous end joining protein LigD